MLIRALSVAMVVVMTSALGSRAEPIDPAQAIAQKFADESEEKKPPPVAAPKTVTPISKKTSPAPNKTASVPPKQIAPLARKEPGFDYEADMLERARAEERDRQKEEEARRVVAKPPAPALPPPAVLPVLEAPAPAPTPDVSPPAPTAVLAAVPVVQPAPATPVRDVPPQTLITLPAAEAPPSPSAIAALSPKPTNEPANVYHDTPAPLPSVQATVLLVLDTGGATVGFKPDPIICIEERCWLSNGIGAPALAMARTKAVALPTTDDQTGDSCSGKSACVYRAVSIDAASRIEVIEVGEGHGASAGAYTVAADESCRMDHTTLVCDNGLATQSFRIWVVPEATADLAGAPSIEDAVAEGLPDTDTQSSNDK